MRHLLPAAFAALLLAAVNVAPAATPHWVDPGIGKATGVAMSPDSSVIIVQREGQDPVRTWDRGQTWTAFTVQGTRPDRFFASPADPKVLYAAQGGGDHPNGLLSYTGPRLYRTRDRGETWELMTSVAAAADGQGLGEFVAGAHPDLVYAKRMEAGLCFTGLCTYSGGVPYRSTDGGHTWVSISTGSPYRTGLAPSPSDPRIL
jgi:photosystem II stability/assembly factor-like uncharacterized protein